MPDEIPFPIHASRRTAIATLALLIATIGAAPARAQTIPTDAPPYCAVASGAAFNKWFQSGAAGLNAAVVPADSVGFSNPSSDNCPFYRWAEQMFMWVTSPIPSNGYGGTSPGNAATILDSTVFYDVAPPDSNMNRALVPHPVTQTFVHTAQPRARQVGPHGLPILLAKDGRPLEVQTQRAGPTGKALITDASGKSVEIARVEVDTNNHATFYDAQGKVIVPSKTPVTPRAGGHTTVVISMQYICRVGATCHGTGLGGGSAGGGSTGAGSGTYIDTITGTVLQTESEQAQAGDGKYPVLLAHNNTLLYYAILVNDVYAWFVAGTNSGAISPAPSNFPTTKADLTKIQNFASGHGVSFIDPNALAIELKTSWIDASTLPAGAAVGYITTQATIPTYNKSSSTLWIPNGHKQVTLALVGLHVVGSVAGHPEMIFATFEHLGNAPNAAYDYVSATPRPPTRGFQTVPVAQNTSGSWLLTTSGSGGPFNVRRMIQLANGNIQADSSPTISPSDTLRLKPWGTSSDTTPNPNVSSPAESNSQVISVNSSVRSLMAAAGAAADIRNNYIMIGATWTLGGAPPTQDFGLPKCFYQGFCAANNVVGSSQLFNTTLETFDQGNGTTLVQNNAQGFNCFDCHGGDGGSVKMSNISHIFGNMTHVTSVPK